MRVLTDICWLQNLRGRRRPRWSRECRARLEYSLTAVLSPVSDLGMIIDQPNFRLRAIGDKFIFLEPGAKNLHAMHRRTGQLTWAPMDLSPRSDQMTTGSYELKDLGKMEIRMGPNKISLCSLLVVDNGMLTCFSS